MLYGGRPTLGFVLLRDRREGLVGGSAVRSVVGFAGLVLGSEIWAGMKSVDAHFATV